MNCIHDYLDPNTTLVVAPASREVWCESCGLLRNLQVLPGQERRKALAAKPITSDPEVVK